MNAPSLRVRLLLGAAGAIFVALTVSWIAMTLLFQRHIERRVADELQRNALQLIANLVLDPDGRPMTSRTPSDSRFIEPAGGLYWQVSTPHGVGRSPSLGSAKLPASPGASGNDWRTQVIDGPFGESVFMIERVIRLDSAGPPVLVQLAHDEATVDHATDEFGRELALWLVLLWGALAGAAWIQVQLGLKPLERVREELDRLRRNPKERLDADHPPEIEPLTAAINALADAREKDLVAARHRAADLAHALKTPLAALAAQSRRAREVGAVEAADGLDKVIAAASATVESELARARVATIRQSAVPAELQALRIVESVIAVVERTDFGAQRVFEVDVPGALTVPLESSAFAELMGALIENAARFARRRVRVSATTKPTLRFCIEDDGPGLGSARAEDALARGGRLDETGPGHGFGLAIARELVEATDGTLAMDRAELGGLRVTLAWAESAAE
jgi:signal transduction histidine kinase